MIAVYCLMLFFVGSCLLGVKYFKELRPEYVVGLWAIGFGAVSLLMFWSSLIWGSFLPAWLVILILACFGAYFFVHWLGELKTSYAGIRSWIWCGLLIAIFALLGFHRWVKFPFIAWDSWALWGLKAKILFVENRIPLQIFRNREILAFDPHPYYPLNLALNEAFLASLYGYFDQAKLKTISFLFGATSGLFVYFFLQRYLRHFLSIVITVIFIFTPMFILHMVEFYSGCSDIVFLFYNLAAAVALWDFYIQKERKYLYFFCLLSSFALWTKIEGVVLILGIEAGILYLFGGKQKIKLSALCLLVPLLVNAPWLIKLVLPNLETANHSFVFSQLPYRLAWATKALAGEMVALHKWGFIWLGSFAVFLLSQLKRPKSRQYNFFTVVLATELLCCLAILTFHGQLLSRFVGNSAMPLDRLLFHTFGIMIIILGLSMGGQMSPQLMER